MNGRGGRMRLGVPFDKSAQRFCEPKLQLLRLFSKTYLFNFNEAQRRIFWGRAPLSQWLETCARSFCLRESFRDYRLGVFTTLEAFSNAPRRTLSR